MFSPVSSRVSFPELDARILEHWKERDVFRRAGTEREGAPRFMLYDGPPTANGSPGIHHVLARIFKDVMCRYKTMKGYQVLRKGGWDTHGLPVELGIEQELGLTSKREIEEFGIEEFNRRCRESVFRYVREWEEMTDRIGFWVDMDDPYVTLENDYIESGWWILKTLWDRGLLYQGMRGTPHCPRCVTSLSSHELALGYQEDTPDPSVFVKFRVESAGAAHRPRGSGRGRYAGLPAGMDDDALDAARQHRSGRGRRRAVFCGRARGRRWHGTHRPGIAAGGIQHTAGLQHRWNTAWWGPGGACLFAAVFARPVRVEDWAVRVRRSGDY